MMQLLKVWLQRSKFPLFYSNDLNMPGEHGDDVINNLYKK